MRIIVIDNKVRRHEWHRSQLNKLQDDSEIELHEAFDIERINNCNADYLLVHKSNQEFSRIEDNDNCGVIRIFFSGGYRKYFCESEKNHYVPEKLLYDIFYDLIKDSTVKV